MIKQKAVGASRTDGSDIFTYSNMDRYPECMLGFLIYKEGGMNAKAYKFGLSP